MDTLALQWLDLFNSTLIPFILMLILSIILIYFVRTSRIRVYGSDSSLSHGRGSIFRLKRDNRLTKTVISLNLIFFALNLPIVIEQILIVNQNISSLIDYAVFLLFYIYYAATFYTQIIVNSEFRNELLKLLGLRTIDTSSHLPTTPISKIEVNQKEAAMNFPRSKQKS